MEDDSDKSKELQSRLIDAEMQAKENRVYTSLLMTLGILLIMFITGVIIVNEFYVEREYLALLVIGSLLFFSGWIWRTRDEKRVISIDEAVEDLGNVEEEGERKFSHN